MLHVESTRRMFTSQKKKLIGHSGSHGTYIVAETKDKPRCDEFFLIDFFTKPSDKAFTQIVISSAKCQECNFYK